MKWFWNYLRQRRYMIALLALSCIIFAVTFCLYGFPVQSVLYPALLCALAWLAFAAWDAGKAYRKHKVLEELSAMSADLMDGSFPQSVTSDDADYQRIIALLRQEQQDLRSDLTLRYTNMADYYTLWAHQIKTPIASMRLTLQSEDSPSARRLMADLLRIEQYVDMVMTYLRLDSDSTDYVIRRCDLDSIVKGAVKKFAGEFITRRLRLQYKPLNAQVLTDEKWLFFVVEQVLSNALKYTPSGSVSISLEEGCVLCIRDTGIGIAPEDLPRIFEKGYTGFNGRTDKKASGIGLFLCKRICSNLNHRIWAESAPDQGTAVFIDLSSAELQPE